MMFEQMKQALIAAAQRAGIAEYEIYYQNEESVSAETLKDEISSFSSMMVQTLQEDSSFAVPSRPTAGVL